MLPRASRATDERAQASREWSPTGETSPAGRDAGGYPSAGCVGSILVNQPERPKYRPRRCARRPSNSPRQRWLPDAATLRVPLLARLQVRDAFERLRHLGELGLRVATQRPTV